MFAGESEGKILEGAKISGNISSGTNIKLQINIHYNGNGGSRKMAPKTRKIKSLSPRPANTQVFEVTDPEHPTREPQQIIIADYFARTLTKLRQF